MRINNGINEFEILDTFVILYIRLETGDEFESFINKEDFEKTKNIKWGLKYLSTKRGWYVRHTKYIGIINGKAKYESVYLDRFIMGLKLNDGIMVDHIYHNTLDNRRENLRLTNNRNNERNRRGENSNNKTGHRNICQVGNRLYIQLQVNGKNTKLASFKLDEMNKAIEFAREMRQKYYGEYAEKD